VSKVGHVTQPSALFAEAGRGAGPAVLRHDTGCPTRGSFTGGRLRTFPWHVHRSQRNRGWPTFTLFLKVGTTICPSIRASAFLELDGWPSLSRSLRRLGKFSRAYAINPGSLS
jgi:hypothetical protein